MLKDNQIAISMDGKGLLARQRLRRAPVEEREVRGGLSENLRLALGREGESGDLFNFYNTSRPHQSLDGQTPDTIYFADLPQNKAAA